MYCGIDKIIHIYNKSHITSLKNKKESFSQKTYKEFCKYSLIVSIKS